MTMLIEFKFRHEVSNEFMQALFERICNNPAIAEWSEHNMDTMNGHDYRELDHNGDILSVHLTVTEELNHTTKRNFIVDGHTIHQGIERLLTGEVDCPAMDLGHLLFSILKDETVELDGELVDTIVQAGLFNDIVFA